MSEFRIATNPARWQRLPIAPGLRYHVIPIREDVTTCGVCGDLIRGVLNVTCERCGCPLHATCYDRVISDAERHAMTFSDADLMMLCARCRS